jgi:hypothetical protein
MCWEVFAVCYAGGVGFWLIAGADALQDHGEEPHLRHVLLAIVRPADLIARATFRFLQACRNGW